MAMVGVVADQLAHLGDGAGQPIDLERSAAREVFKHRHAVFTRSQRDGHAFLHRLWQDDAVRWRPLLPPSSTA